MPLRLVAFLGLVTVVLLTPLVAQEKSAAPVIVAKLKGHTDAVYAAAYSPNGKYIVTASFDHTLKLWDAATGKEVKTYAGTAGHTKQVISVAFSQDGSMIASGSTDNTLKVWDVPMNAPIRSLKTSDVITAVALSPDGLKLAIGGKDGSLKLVAPTDFKELVKFEAGHQGAISKLAFTANNQTLVSVGADRTLRYWDAAKGKLLATVGAHAGAVNNLVVHPNNTAAYTVGDDGFLKFWAMPAAASKTLPGHVAPIQALAMTADGAGFYTGGDDRTVRQFALAQAKELRALIGPQASITSIATHPANTFVAAGTADSRIYLWNNGDGKKINDWLAHASGAVHSVQIVAPGQQLLSAGADGLVKFWALPSVPPRTLVHPDAVLAAVASADGKKLYTGSNDKLVRIWDTAKQALEKQFAGHTGPVTAVAISPNQQILASGGADHTIRLWNQATAKESDVLLAHTAPLTALAINANNTQMLSASEDGAVKLWQLPLVPPKAMMHPDQIITLALTADGNKVVTASNDKIVRLWNLANGVKERDYAGAGTPILNAAVSNNSATIAASCADKMVLLWNSADAKLLHKLPMPALAHALAFSPDGQSVFVGLADNGIKQIKVADGKEIKPFPAKHGGAISGLAVAPKGDLLYSASADKTILASTLPDGAAKRKFDHVAPITAMALSKDATLLAAVADKVIKVWLTADAKELAAIKLPTEAKSISLSPDNARVIVSGADKLARVFALDGKLLEMLPHDGAVHAAAFVDAKRVVTGGADKLARLWTSSLLWQRHHQGPVRQAVFTPKGDQIVSASADKAIKIWNVADAKELKSFTNDAPLTHMSLTGDASKIVTAGTDQNIKVWNVADGKPTLTLPLSSPVQSVAFSPNGQRLAIATQDGPSNVIRVHDVALGKDVQTFAEHTGPIRSLQYLADGRTLVSASLDKTARLLDVGVVSALAAHPAGATYAQYHGNGTQLLTAGADKIVKLWDLPKGSVLKSFGPVADPIKAIAFSKDFTRFAVATGKNVKVWTSADGKEIAALPHMAEVLVLSFSPDNTRIVTGSLDRQTRLWDIATAKELQFFARDDAVAAVQHLANNVIVSAAGKVTRIDTTSIVKQIVADAGPVHALTMTPANTHLLTGGADKTVKLWNIANGNKEREFIGSTPSIPPLPRGGNGGVRAVAISKNGQLLASGGADALVRVYQFADGKELGSAKVGEVRALAFSPNNLALVGASMGKTLDAWTVPFTAGQPVPKDFLSPAQSWTTAGLINDFAFAADSASIYSAGPDKATHVWKLASPNPTRNFALGNNVDAVAFQPIGNLLASGAHDGKVKLFDLVKNAQVKDITAHVSVINKNNVPQPVYSLSFTPDGKQFLTSSFDGSLKLWDTASGNLVREFKAHKVKEFEKGHQEPVYTAAFSPDGKFIASGSSGLERVIKIWSLDGKVVRDLANPHYPTSPSFPATSHPGSVTNLRFTKDGKHLVSVGDAPGNKGFVAIWDWQAGNLLTSSTLPHGVYYGLAIAPDEKTFVVTAGNRDRKGASPDFNAAYLMKMPALGK